MEEPYSSKAVRGTDGAEDQPLIPFEPVPVRPRHDGWTVEKQYTFVEALAQTGIVEEACRRVGMTRTSFDKLRHRPCGVHFRRACQAALDYGLHRVEENAHRRAREGVARPIFHKGEQVGEYRHFDERLTMFLLRSYRPERYGKARDLPPAVDDDEYVDEYERNDPGLDLEGQLTGIEFRAGDVPAEDEDDEPYAL
jgi:hypothetical protein